MPDQKYVFRAHSARRAPDPVHPGITRHYLTVPVREMPKGLPLSPNARAPKIRSIYRDVDASLMNDLGVPYTFHLKHKGITVIAESVQPVDGKKDEFVVTLGEGHGVLDGGHSYELITRDREDDLPENFVEVKVLTEIPSEWIPEISGGLNTSVQVQAFSLDNLAGDFDWLKALLKDEPYYPQIAWRENDPGALDARDVISLMTLFLIDDYPNNEPECPIAAYDRKHAALKRFEEKPGLYKKVAPILRDILVLHDTILASSQELWNARPGGGRFAALHFVESRARGFELAFTGETIPARLMRGAHYPILGAFRAKVVKAGNGKYAWGGGFKSVLALWQETAAELLQATLLEGQQVGLKADAIGKSRSHWPNVHRIVAFRDLQKKLDS
jgi:AIPR protein